MSTGNLAAVVTRLEDDTSGRHIEVRDIDIPEPKEGQVQIRYTLRPLNPTDFLKASGLYLGVEKLLPFTGGSEATGTISKLGANVSGLAVGDRVVVGQNYPSWQQYGVADARLTLKVPDSIDERTAAQFFINPVTVTGLVETAAVPEGEWLLQGAGFSALGRQLSQYAKHIGLKVISVVRRPEQVDKLKAFGSAEVIDSSSEDVVARVLEITGGKGAWAALDPIVGEFTTTAIRSVRTYGTVLVYGGMSSREVTFPLIELLQKSRTVSAFIVMLWVAADGPEKERQRLENALNLIEKGVIKPETEGEEFDLKDVHSAIKAHFADGRSQKVYLIG